MKTQNTFTVGGKQYISETINTGNDEGVIAQTWVFPAPSLWQRIKNVFAKIENQIRPLRYVYGTAPSVGYVMVRLERDWFWNRKNHWPFDDDFPSYTSNSTAQTIQTINISKEIECQKLPPVTAASRRTCRPKKVKASSTKKRSSKNTAKQKRSKQ